MLLTFVGQAFASATLSCNHDMVMDQSMSMMANNNMADTTNHTPMMLEKREQASSQHALMDCCQEECKCPMSGCISVSLLFNNIHFDAEITVQQKIAQLPLILQSQINVSLYRPPIS